jgi:malate dehydrogenase
MVDAISRDRRRLLPCVAPLDGEYGQRDIAMGVPCVLSERGLELVVELDLSEAEVADFAASAATVRKDLAKLS